MHQPKSVAVTEPRESWTKMSMDWAQELMRISNNNLTLFPHEKLDYNRNKKFGALQQIYD